MMFKDTYIKSHIHSMRRGPLLALVLTLVVVAVIGISKEVYANGVATIIVTSKARYSDGSKYTPLAGVSVTINHGWNGSCDQKNQFNGHSATTTNGSGVAQFTNCLTGRQAPLNIPGAGDASYGIGPVSPPFNGVTNYSPEGSRSMNVTPTAGQTVNWTANFVSSDPTPATPVAISAKSGGKALGNGAEIASGQSVTITWECRQSSFCRGSGAWNNTLASSGSQTFTPAAGSHTFNVTAVAEGSNWQSSESGVGWNKKSITVKVAKAASAPSGGSNSSGGGTKKTPLKNKQAQAAPAIVTSTTDDKTAPMKPSGVTVKQQGDELVVSWPEGSDDKGVKGYVLERSIDGVTWEVVSEGITETSYTDKNIEPGTYYFYRVRTVDTSGNQSETALSEVVLAAADKKDESAKTVATVSDKKDNSSPVVFVGMSLVGLVVLAGGTVWWLKHRAAQNMAYGYDTSMTGTQPPVLPGNDTTVINPGLAPSNQAPHASMSLKDMVMQDYHPEDPHNKPPQSPQNP